jgi:hypothetical protein
VHVVLADQDGQAAALQQKRSGGVCNGQCNDVMAVGCMAVSAAPLHVRVAWVGVDGKKDPSATCDGDIHVALQTSDPRHPTPLLFAVRMAATLTAAQHDSPAAAAAHTHEEGNAAFKAGDFGAAAAAYTCGVEELQRGRVTTTMCFCSRCAVTAAPRTLRVARIFPCWLIQTQPWRWCHKTAPVAPAAHG